MADRKACSLHQACWQAYVRPLVLKHVGARAVKEGLWCAGTTPPQVLGMLAAFQNAEHLDAHRSALSWSRTMCSWSDQAARQSLMQADRDVHYMPCTAACMMWQSWPSWGRESPAAPPKPQVARPCQRLLSYRSLQLAIAKRCWQPQPAGPRLPQRCLSKPKHRPSPEPNPQAGPPLCRWSPGPHQERATLLQVLEAASQGALARTAGHSVTSLSLRGRPDVDDEMVLHACQLFPCLRYGLCGPRGRRWGVCPWACVPGSVCLLDSKRALPSCRPAVGEAVHCRLHRGQARQGQQVTPAFDSDNACHWRVCAGQSSCRDVCSDWGSGTWSGRKALCLCLSQWQ